jgi:hypothetical protein
MSTKYFSWSMYCQVSQHGQYGILTRSLTTKVYGSSHLFEFEELDGGTDNQLFSYERDVAMTNCSLYK